MKLKLLILKHLSIFYCALIYNLFLNVLCKKTSNDQFECKAVQNCGECIKQHPECAWCTDSRANVSNRCDLKSNFINSESCSREHIYSPTTEVKIASQHNLPIGNRRSDSVTPIQMEPQQVEVKMKPGDVVEIPFYYLHKEPVTGFEVKDFTIQTSEYQSLGLQIDFSIDCHGKRKNGRVCPNIMINEKISFFAKISFKDCSKKNLIAVSVGIYGYNTVSAIFVTPICGCDCENPRFQEKRSPKCNYKGNLVCGVCLCDEGKGGDSCECNLNQYGVNNANTLLNQCKQNDDALVCSGKGKCSCGKCSCNANYIRGHYCECDDGNCPLNIEGRMCSGRGECRCGVCACETGYFGEDCSCTQDQSSCIEDGVTCSQNGFCECGKCSCNTGWTGATCNVQIEKHDAESTTYSSFEKNNDEKGQLNSNDLQDDDKSLESDSKALESMPDGALSSLKLNQFVIVNLLNSVFLIFTYIIFSF